MLQVDPARTHLYLYSLLEAKGPVSPREMVQWPPELPGHFSISPFGQSSAGSKRCATCLCSKLMLSRASILHSPSRYRLLRTGTKRPIGNETSLHHHRASRFVSKWLRVARTNAGLWTYMMDESFPCCRSLDVLPRRPRSQVNASLRPLMPHYSLRWPRHKIFSLSMRDSL